MNSLCHLRDKTQSLRKRRPLAVRSGEKVKVLDMLCLLDIFIFMADDATLEDPFSADITILSHAT